jgi:site-specific DNA-cytosine methylase
MFENVKGILQAKFKPFKDALVKSWEDAGYNVYYKALNTKDFGIPQTRNRVFFIGIRKDLNQTFKFPETIPLKIKLKDVLEDLPFRDIPKFQFSNYGDKQRLSCLKDVNSDYFNTLTTNRSHANQYLLNATRDKCRFLSGREAFRLQGFIKDEINLNTLSENEAFHLAGNGQSLNVVVAVLKNLLVEEATQ